VLAVALLGAEPLGADLADVGLHVVGRVVGENVTRIFAGGHLKLRMIIICRRLVNQLKRRLELSERKIRHEIMKYEIILGSTEKTIKTNKAILNRQ
jgi:hypothetical protein